ncbi:MAG: FHA domain-containing protein [Caldisericia bacterium]
MNNKGDFPDLNFYLKKFINSLLLINLSIEPVEINHIKLGFLDYIILNELAEINIKNYRIFIKLNSLKYNPKLKIRKKEIKIKCPYCTYNLDLNNKFCNFCGFDGGSENYKYYKRYDYYFEYFDYEKEEYLKFSNYREDNKYLIGTPNAELEIIDKFGKNIRVPIIDEITTIGRSIYNSISFSELKDLSMSRYHIKIIKKLDGYYIEDNNSLNGTFVNGKLIKSIKLQDGDIINIGNTKMRFYLIKKKEKKLWIK